jgi:hypothetical protein
MVVRHKPQAYAHCTVALQNRRLILAQDVQQRTYRSIEHLNFFLHGGEVLRLIVAVPDDFALEVGCLDKPCEGTG